MLLWSSSFKKTTDPAHIFRSGLKCMRSAWCSLCPKVMLPYKLFWVDVLFTSARHGKAGLGLKVLQLSFHVEGLSWFVFLVFFVFLSPSLMTCIVQYSNAAHHSGVFLWFFSLSLYSFREVRTFFSQWSSPKHVNCATIFIRIAEHYQSVQSLFLSNHKVYLIQKDALLSHLQL